MTYPEDQFQDLLAEKQSLIFFVVVLSCKKKKQT